MFLKVVRAWFALFFMTMLAAAAQAQTAAHLPNVVILATGGTIAGTGATSTTTVGYTAAKVGVDDLIKAVPELKQVANVTGEQVFQIASENMSNEHWLTLAKRVNTLLAKPDVDGIVITHGTDTIEETAYFLDLVVKSRKPVVVVGAMRPSTAISADGPINLYNAVALAGSKEAVGKGVLVALNDQINAEREVTKTNTVSADTFKATELGFLGYMLDGKPRFYRASLRKHGLTEQQWRILRALGGVETIEVTELARSAYLLGPSLSRILRDLEQRGLIERRSVKTDLRRGLVSISPEGLRLIEAVAPSSEAIYAEMTRRYGADRLAALHEMLSALEASLADMPLPSNGQAEDDDASL